MMNDATKGELAKRWEALHPSEAPKMPEAEINPRNNKPAYTRRRKETPAVLKSFPDIVSGKLTFKVRVISYSNTGPLLDIREWLDYEAYYDDTGRAVPAYRGFGKRGLSLNAKNVAELESLLPEIKSVL